MKLLNWMRVKIKQTNTNPLKEFVTGNYGGCCLRPGSCFVTNQNTKSVTCPNHVYRNSSSEKGHLEEEREEEVTFPGFLAIGTLGLEPPATPKLFDAPLEEDGSQEKMEVITEDELKLISDKIEMFLESETEQSYNGSMFQIKEQHLSGLGEFSDTASLKAEESNPEEYGEPVMFPLQGYLLGSSLELLKENDKVKKKKGSIADLFQRKKSAEKPSFSERRDSIKKTTMWRKLHGTAKKSFTHCGKDDDDDDSVPQKKKLRKIGQLFRRKIHPVICTSETEGNKPNKDQKIDDMFRNRRSYINGDDLIYRHGGGDNQVSSSSEEGFLSSETSSDMTQYEVVGKSPNGKREKWINTDSEYLVLEL
ncbi:PREDICTED: protein LAZY 1 isoform X2 [Tarenaya hassleriana]|uniref:protein LAZY 1 isoform X2 n=1 Tax=Tarenaya hassleriana TaxID=28532 RepID=UPI00053C2CBB|nr:PREDICTED: protein LAZY 1 isoform X2 [Tarenaya hassleriana]